MRLPRAADLGPAKLQGSGAFPQYNLSVAKETGKAGAALGSAIARAGGMVSKLAGLAGQFESASSDAMAYPRASIALSEGLYNQNKQYRDTATPNGSNYAGYPADAEKLRTSITEQFGPGMTPEQRARWNAQSRHTVFGATGQADETRNGLVVADFDSGIAKNQEKSFAQLSQHLPNSDTATGWHDNDTYNAAVRAHIEGIQGAQKSGILSETQARDKITKARAGFFAARLNALSAVDPSAGIAAEEKANKGVPDESLSPQGPDQELKPGGPQSEIKGVGPQSSLTGTDGGQQGAPGAQSGEGQQSSLTDTKIGKVSLATNITDYSSGRGSRDLPSGNVKNIVLHDVSGSNRNLPDARNIPEYHVVFDDKGIYQAVPFDKQAPHAMAFNKNSIAIAYRGFEGDTLSPQSIANGAKAVAMVADKFGIAPENILTHPGAGPTATRSGKDPKEASWRGQVLEFIKDHGDLLKAGGQQVAEAVSGAAPKLNLPPNAKPAQISTAVAQSQPGVIAAVTDQHERSFNKQGYGERVTGSITVNGNTYEFVNGGSERGSIPLGNYEVKRYTSGRTRADEGHSYTRDAFELSDVQGDAPSTKDSYARNGLLIHESRTAVTAGCIGIKGDFEQFKRDLFADAKKNGKMTLALGTPQTFTEGKGATGGSQQSEAGAQGEGPPPLAGLAKLGGPTPQEAGGNAVASTAGQGAAPADLSPGEMVRRSLADPTSVSYQPQERKAGAAGASGIVAPAPTLVREGVQAPPEQSQPSPTNPQGGPTPQEGAGAGEGAGGPPAQGISQEDLAAGAAAGNEMLQGNVSNEDIQGAAQSLGAGAETGPIAGAQVSMQGGQANVRVPTPLVEALSQAMGQEGGADQPLSKVLSEEQTAQLRDTGFIDPDTATVGMAFKLVQDAQQAGLVNVQRKSGDVSGEQRSPTGKLLKGQSFTIMAVGGRPFTFTAEDWNSLSATQRAKWRTYTREQLAIGRKVTEEKFKNMALDNLDTIEKSGHLLSGFDPKAYDRFFKDQKQPQQAVIYQRKMQAAALAYEAKKEMWDQPNDVLRARKFAFKSRTEDDKGNVNALLSDKYEEVAAEIDGVIAMRDENPADAAEHTDVVQSYRANNLANGRDPQIPAEYYGLIDARIQAQRRYGMRVEPISKQEADGIMRPVTEAVGLIARERAAKDVARMLHGTYREHAKLVLDTAYRLMRKGSDDARKSIDPRFSTQHDTYGPFRFKKDTYGPFQDGPPLEAPLTPRGQGRSGNRLRSNNPYLPASE